MIVYLKSDESNDFFPENKPWNFKVHLRSPLIFNGNWNVGLVEFHASGQNSRNKTVNIFSNICGTSILQGGHTQILRRVTTQKDNHWDISVISPFYLPLYLKEIYEFDICINDINGQEASFLLQPVLLTLHFVRQP